MKFTLKCIKDGCRLGVLSDFAHNGTAVLETPACLLYTRRGSVPHLSADVLKRVNNLPSIAHMQMTMLAENEDAIAEFQKGLSHFCGMKDYLVYTSLYDPTYKVDLNHNRANTVAVWTKCGKMDVDVETFVRVQEAFKPDLYQSLCDSGTNLSSGKNRTRKAVERTLKFLDAVLDKVQHSKVLKDTPLFGVIEGGANLHDRITSAKETALRPVSGFVLEGFHSLGSSALQINFLEDTSSLIKETLKHLPEDKPRVLHNGFSPDQVLQAVELGIDVFDSTYPYLVTEVGGALVFDFHYSPSQEEIIDPAMMANNGYYINLKDNRYVEDFGPILKDCSCYTCQTFTRAYINHLLNTSELLSSVLLMIHNLEHYLKFFEAVRKSITEEKFSVLKRLIEKQRE